jgi:hypothetical protein
LTKPEQQGEITMNKVPFYISSAFLLGLVVLPVTVSLTARLCSSGHASPKQGAVAVQKHQVSTPKVSKLVPNLDIPMDGNDLGPSDAPVESKPKAAKQTSKSSGEYVTDLVPDGTELMAPSQGTAKDSKFPVLQSKDVPTPRGVKMEDQRATATIPRHA